MGKMNRRGEETFSEMLLDNVIYIILVVAFFVGCIYFIDSRASGGVVWEDFYAKELAGVIDYARVGDKYSIDVQKATEVSFSNGQKDFEQMFVFDNLKNEVCVKLSNGGRTCFSYFSDVDVTNIDVVKGKPVNILVFEIKEKPRSENG